MTLPTNVSDNFIAFVYLRIYGYSIAQYYLLLNMSLISDVIKKKGWLFWDVFAAATQFDCVLRCVYMLLVLSVFSCRVEMLVSICSQIRLRANWENSILIFLFITAKAELIARAVFDVGRTSFRVFPIQELPTRASYWFSLVKLNN